MHTDPSDDPPDEDTDDADADPSSGEIPTVWQTVIGPQTNPTATLGQHGTDRIPRSASDVRPRTSTIGRGDARDPSADLPDYELGWRLGSGGMGVVMSARQTSCDRVVAVKLMQSEKKEEKRRTLRRERFLGEAVVTADLDHPNIPPVYDVGCSHGGELFYSMKHVSGTPWLKVLAENELAENLEILAAVANAVAFAHSRGVLHRDIKPANVMLGDFGEVYLMDWGLAVAVPEHELADPDLHTKAMPINERSAAGGTPAYMAPEMAHAQVEEIGIRSDVYLLGAVLFEILVGEPPHPGETASDCLIAAAANCLVPTDEVENGELLRIAHRAMARRPADRFADVPAFLAALRHYQEHAESITLADQAAHLQSRAATSGADEDFNRAIFTFRDALDLWPDNLRAQAGLQDSRLAYAASARRRGDLELAEGLFAACGMAGEERRREVRLERRNRNRRRRRLRLATRAAAALVLLLLAVSLVAYVQVSRARAASERQRDLARRAERRAREEGDRARTVNNFLQDMLAAPDPLRDGRQVKVVDVLDRAAAGVETDFAARPRLRAQINHTLGSSYLALGRLERAETHLAAAAGDLERLGLDHDRAGLLNVSALGELHLARDRVRRAERVLRRTLAAQERECGPGDPQTLATGRHLVETLLAAGRLREAGELLEDLRERSDGADALAATALQGRLLYHLGRREEADAAYTAALAAARRRHGERHPEVLLLRMRHARHLGEAGDYAAATAAFRAVLDPLGEVMGRDHPAVLRCKLELARILQRMGHADEAAALLAGMLAVQEQALGPKHADTVRCRAWLGLALSAAGRKAEGEALLRDALKVQERRHGKEHPATLRLRAMLGRALMHGGRVEEGCALLEDAVARAGRVLGREHADVVEMSLWLGRGRQLAGRHAESEALLRDLAGRLATGKGADHPHRICCLWFLSDPIWQQGRLGEATGILARAAALADERYADPGSWPAQRIRQRLEEFLAKLRPCRRVHCDHLRDGETGPVIDGRLADACWERPHPLRAYEAFAFLAEDDYTPPAADPVAVFVGDDAHLYLAVRCPADGETRPCRARDRDGPVEADDAVELRWRLSGEEVPLRLMVNRDGVLADARGDDRSLDIAGLRVAVGADGDGWTLECALPWSALGSQGRPADGTALPFDLIRILPGDPPRRYRWQQLDPARDHDAQYGKLVVGPYDE